MTRAAQQLRAAWQERHDEVLAAGGLHIIGTERHESRRIDNQLRGRSGRQGDPGSSRFYLSMEDTLMRIFGDPNRTKKLLQFAGMKEGEVIESGMLTRQIEKAQRKVEAHNFDIRKQLLLFDDVANDQRKVVYQQRTGILGATDLSEAVAGMREEAVKAADRPVRAAPDRARGLGPGCPGRGAAARFQHPHRCQGLGRGRARARGDHLPRPRGAGRGRRQYEPKVERIGEPLMRQIEREIVLRNLDQHWREHLAAMDYLRQGIHLRGYAQKDYRYEFKREAFELFSSMLDRVKFDIGLDAVPRRSARRGRGGARGGRAAREADARAAGAARRGAVGCCRRPSRCPSRTGSVHGAAADQDGAIRSAPFVRGERKVGRNEPCPCGSGKKFKQCHGSLSA